MAKKAATKSNATGRGKKTGLRDLAPRTAKSRMVAGGARRRIYISST